MKLLKKIIYLNLIFLVSCTAITTPTPEAKRENTPTPEVEQDNTPTPSTQTQTDTIIVTNSHNSGPGSLRQALSDARDDYTITFDPAVFPPDSPATIYVSREQLPGIDVNNLTLDASNAGVILDGKHLEGEWIAGLAVVSSDENRIMGLQISNFPGPGVAISGDARHNIIGGDRSAGAGPWGQGNLITNNVYGIDIATSGTTNNTVTGNLIGVDLDGSYWLGNHSFGIHIGEGATENTIGPDNILAYNRRDAVYIDPQIRAENTITDNQIYKNAIGIGWPQPPSIFDFNMAAGTVTGAACPDCTVEIYSTSGYGEELEGSVFEGETTADENGAFTFEKGEAFTGPFLSAQTINLRGRTSIYFSYPLTSGTEKNLVLQIGNDLPRRQYLLEFPIKLADNHLASQYPGIGYNEDRSDFTYIYRGGKTRARVSISGLEPEEVDWSKPEFSISAAQHEHFTRLEENNVVVTYVLMFWDKETYPNGEGAPCARFQTEEEIERWLEYVRFTVQELGEYVDYFEIWNEPDIQNYCPKAIMLDDYINLIQRTVPVIRDVDPEAKIVVGAVSGTYYPQAKNYLFGLLTSDIMPLVDVISFHPLYGESPKYEEERDYYYNYPDFLQRIMDTAAANGFSGEFHADEVGWTRQPHGGQSGEFSLIETHKYFLRAVMLHRGMGVDLGGRGGYYPTGRRVSTAMAGVEPAELPVEIDSEAGNIMTYSFSTMEGDRLVAVWTNGIVVDDDPGVESTITIPDFSASEVVGIDLLNNLEQDLIFKLENGNLIISNLLIKDFPLIIKLSNDLQ